MISRRFKLALALGGVAGATVVAAFGAAVRHEASHVAERYGAEVAIDRVIPGLHGVRLRGVNVTLAEVPSTRIHLDEIEVGLGGVKSVALRGGLVSSRGSREAVLREIDAWRARRGSGGSGSGSGRALSVSGIRVEWRNSETAPTEALTATDVSVAREDGKVRLVAGGASITLGRAVVDVKNGHLELVRREGGYRFAALSADRVEAEVAIPGAKADVDTVPVRSEADVDVDRPGKGSGSRLPAEAARQLLVSAAQVLDAALEPGAQVRLSGVHARIQRDGDSLNLGPGALGIARDAGRVVVDLTPELRAGKPQAGAQGAGERDEEALTFRLSVPLSGAGSQEIVADVLGGPIWLSSLGVREGDFGLFDVSRASLSTRSHLVLSADGKSLRVDGEGRARSVSIRSPSLSDEPISGLELAFRIKADAALDGSRVHVDEGEVDLGAIHLGARGDFERTREAYKIRGTFDVPLTACQSMLDSTPKGLVPKLTGVRFAGSFAVRGRADIDTARLDRGGFRLEWDVSNSCRVVEAPPEIHVERFRKAFRRTAFDTAGRPVQIESGPGSADWVSIGSISKFMEVAVLTTEDGGFQRHHGFDHEAIRNSIRENLRKKKFVRGASTISMQLAKNLYLDRTKNLSRKLQEAVLTMYLEQELTKEQVLELYLNVVEFGPMVYGVGPAARHYFNGSAGELSLGQALYLSSIMPNPKVQHFGAGGAVAQGWMNYLHKLMRLANDRKPITDEELDEGLRETVVRGARAPLRDKAAHVDGRGIEPEPLPPVDVEELGP